MFKRKKKKKRTRNSQAKHPVLNKVKVGARTYLLLTGVGTAAIVAAPFAALYWLLKPDPQENQKKFFNNLNSSISLAGDQLPRSLYDAVEKLDLSNLDFLGLESEPWKQKHRQQHEMSDLEWEEKNGKIK